MSININQVYKTVLVVLQKEKRGVLTPTEFNKIATQAQQEIFTEYFDELNGLLRQPQTDVDYADRVSLLDEKIQIFKKSEKLNTNTDSNVTPTTAVQELGTVVYLGVSNKGGREVERIQKSEVYTTSEGSLTAPSKYYPVYTYENNIIQLYPKSIGAGVNNVEINYLKYPVPVVWGFTIDTELGNYIYNAQSSVDFELHQSDQPLLVDKILGYAGVMTRDQLAVQFSGSKEQQIDIDGQK